MHRPATHTIPTCRCGDIHDEKDWQDVTPEIVDEAFSRRLIFPSKFKGSPVILILRTIFIIREDVYRMTRT